MSPWWRTSPETTLLLDSSALTKTLVSTQSLATSSQVRGHSSYMFCVCGLHVVHFYELMHCSVKLQYFHSSMSVEVCWSLLNKCGGLVAVFSLEFCFVFFFAGGNQDGKFSVGFRDGIVRTVVGLDRETQAAYTLVIEAIGGSKVYILPSEINVLFAKVSMSSTVLFRPAESITSFWNGKKMMIWK